MNYALQKILDKPYGTRPPLEQCISDAVTLEDEHDGDYELMEQAAEEYEAVEGLVTAIGKWLKSVRSSRSLLYAELKATKYFEDMEQAYKKIAEGSPSNPSDVGN